MGGFTMHCRTGLNTPYLGEEFLDVVKACVDKAGALQMKACLYDEDRWPSGACGGAVTKDPEFRSRYLVFTPFSKEEGTGRKESESISAAKGVFTGKGTELARYQIELHRVSLGRLSRGRHLIELTACGSRINTFGQVHLTDEELTWFGPESWRTGGDRFSYEYQLKRTGVLAAPMLFKLI